MPKYGRALTALGALLVTAFLISPSAEQQKAQKKTKEQEQFEQALQTEIRELVQVVDKVAAGETAPSEMPLGFQNHYLKARDERTFSPFMLTVPPESVSAPTVLLYYRLVEKGKAGTPNGSQEKQGEQAQYAFEDVHGMTVPAPKPGEPHLFMRAFAVVPGEYDLYLGLRERPAPPPKKKPDPKAAPPPPPKTTVIHRTVTVPDFYTGKLQTSSIMLADRVDHLEAPPTEQQMVTHPYMFGMTRLTPSPDQSYTKAQNISMLFLVYNTQVDADKKPDVQVDYNFHQVVEKGERFFNRTEPQAFNPRTLPPQFDQDAGHQIMAGQEIPLASFPEGEYRLEIRVTDKLAKQTIVENVRFKVTAS